MAFGISIQKALRRKERRTFLEKEVRHLLLICHEFKDYSDPFFSWGHKYVTRLREVLAYLERYEAEAGEDTTEGIENLLTVEEFYDSFPQLVQNIGKAYAIRVPHPIRLYSDSTVSRFSLAEMHPDFNQAILALESVNSAYSAKLSHVLAHFDFIPPLLVVSGSYWLLVAFPDKNSRLFDLEDANIEQRRKLFDYFLHLSWIALPTWAPMSVGDGAILSHTNFHRVLQLATFAMHDLTKGGETSRGHLDRATKFAQEQLYGGGIIDLVVCWQRLALALRDLLQKLRSPKRAEPLDDDVQALERSYESVFQGKLELSAYRCASEFLADIGGILLAGPSFLFALLFDPSSTSRGLSLTRSPLSTLTHPPTLVRVKVLTRILSHIGFETLSQKCQRIAETYAAQLMFVEEEAAILNEYYRFLEDNLPLFFETADFLGKLMPQCSGGRIGRGEISERDWLDEKRQIMSYVSDGSLPTGSPLVEEIVNTVWYKKVFGPEPSPLRGDTPWRIMLRRCIEQPVKEV